MTTQAKINWALGVVLVGALYYLSTNKTPQIDPNTLNNDLPLSLNSKGAEVAQLQTILKQKYSADLGNSGQNHDGIDGDFGSLTLTALKKYTGLSSVTLKQIGA